MIRSFINFLFGRPVYDFQSNPLCGDQRLSNEQIAMALGNQRDSPQLKAVAQVLAYEYSACVATATDPDTANRPGELAHATGGMRAIENVLAQLHKATEVRDAE